MRGNGIDLGALATVKHAPDIDRGLHRLAFGRLPDAFREDRLVAIEFAHERGHFLQSVGAAMGEGTMGGLAVNDHLKPDRAVVAAAHRATFAALHHDRIVGSHRSLGHEPACSENGIGLLVGRERHLDIHLGLGAGGAQRPQRQQETRNRALHIRRAASINPTRVNGPAKRRGVFPAAGDGHDIIVRVEVNRLPGTANRQAT